MVHRYFETFYVSKASKKFHRCNFCAPSALILALEGKVVPFRYVIYSFAGNINSCFRRGFGLPPRIRQYAPAGGQGAGGDDAVDLFGGFRNGKPGKLRRQGVPGFFP